MMSYLLTNCGCRFLKSPWVASQSCFYPVELAPFSVWCWMSRVVAKLWKWSTEEAFYFSPSLNVAANLVPRVSHQGIGGREALRTRSFRCIAPHARSFRPTKTHRCWLWQELLHSKTSRLFALITACIHFILLKFKRTKRLGESIWKVSSQLRVSLSIKSA